MKRPYLLFIFIGIFTLPEIIFSQGCITVHLGLHLTESEKGILVQGVMEGSPAAEAGILVGDILLEVDGQKVENIEMVAEIVRQKEANGLLRLKVARENEEKIFSVRLGKGKCHNQKRGKIQGGGFGGFSPTLSIFNFNKVNEVLAQNQFTNKFSQTHFGFGGGGWAQVGKVTIGGFGFGGSQSVASDSLAIDADFGAGFFEVGYIPITIKFFNPRFLLGIGGGGFTFFLKPNKIPPTNFEDLIKNPNFGAKITKGGFALSPGLSLDFPISFIGFSLKGGYIFFPGKSSWEYETGQKMNNGPDLNLSGPYFQFYIFFGGRG
ncbi:MAG: PDZ domain-containing protein [candidate division WOR-3 bacterium]